MTASRLHLQMHFFSIVLVNHDQGHDNVTILFLCYLILHFASGPSCGLATLSLKSVASER